MARKTKPTIVFRRKRELKTNYHKRLKLLLSRKPRLVIRISLKNVIAQIIEFDPKGDKVIASADSKDLQKFGWKYSRANTPAAYLVGLLVAKKAVKKNVKEAIVDIGLKSAIPKSKMFAAVKGAADAGLKIPFSEDAIPSEERISGKHIADYASALKGNAEYEKKFSAHLKNNLIPEKITEQFEKTKQSILSS